jgi:hypothetical protein
MKNTLFFFGLLSTIISGFSSGTHASEVDNFTYRGTVLKDSTDAINLYSNKLFNQILEHTNRFADPCDENALYENLHRHFRNAALGKFNKYIDKSPELERIAITPRDSIYGDLKINESFGLGLHWNWVDKLSYASIINIRGQYIGVDKFEHFAGSGYAYFQNYYINKKSIESTLAIGTHDENGILGKYSSGVISFGDMTAEFNGMRFWNHILAKNPDIIGINLGPYVKCENKSRWVKVKDIDFSQYVDAAWDESLNCSMFRTQEMLDNVKQRLKKLEDVTGKNYSCPMNREVITNILPKYGPYSEKIINTEGQKAEKN